MANAFVPILLLASLPGVSLLSVAAAVAAVPQQEATATATSAPAPAQPAIPKTLKEALGKASWDPASRGPLLIIAPELTLSKPLWQTRYEEMQKKNALSGEPTPPLSPPFPPPASNGEFRVLELAEFYGRRLVRLNGITVLAPETMIVLNDNPGKPDIYAGMQQDQKVQMFQATLTEAQWAKMGSDTGLGVGDLKDDQRDLFMAVLPDPFKVMRGTAMGNGGTQFGSESQPEKLVGNQRSGIRLRISRTIQMGLYQQGGSRVSATVGNRRPGDTVNTLNTWETERSEEKSFGQKLRADVPTRLKPQQIDFDAAALNPRVSLSGAKTIGDLVERIRIATRLELYVDPRLGKQLVWLRATDDTTLRAGDLLRSLCWGIAGAVRYIEEGKVFILTDDIAGWGTRVARVQAWVSMGEQLRQQQSQKFAAEIRKRNPVQYLKFDAKDPMAIKPEQMAEIESKWSTYQGRYQGLSIPLEKLTPEQQELARSSASEHNAQFARSQQPQSEYYRPVEVSRVSMTMRARLVFSVPGVGDVEDQNSGWSMLDNMIPVPDRATLVAENSQPLKKTISLPFQSAMGGILKAAPKDAAQAKRVVQAARERGFRQVWISVPSPRFDATTTVTTTPAPENSSKPDLLPNYEVAAREGQALLAAVIEEGKSDGKKPVSVVAVVGLFTALPSPAAVGAASVDYNLLGETASQLTFRQAGIMASSGQVKYAEYVAKNAKEWLLPTTPGLLPRLKKYVVSISAVPGLAGMTLTDTAAPGYDLSGASDQMYFSSTDSQMGYVPAYRSEFVRTAGYDPVDLVPVSWGSSADLTHPLMGKSTPSYGSDGRPTVGEQGSIGTQWNKARFARATDVLLSLYAALEAEKPLVRQVSAGTPGAPRLGAAALQGKFPLFLRAPQDPYGSYILWDRKDTITAERKLSVYDSNFAQNSANALRASSSRCLLSYSYFPSDLYDSPDAPKPPTTLAERGDLFAQGYNQTLQYRKAIWDGFIFDFSQADLDAALPLLSVVSTETAAAPVRKPRPFGR